jgi:MFS family permease
MPAAITRLPTDTTLPGETRRQVWPMPDVTSHSLLVLTATRLFLAPASTPPSQETISSLERGGDPNELLGPDAVAIDLAAVHQLTLVLAANTLTIHYTPPGQQPTEIAVTFATPELVDTLFAKLWRRLGDGMTLHPVQPHKWSLLRAPLLVMGTILTLTLALAVTMNAAADGSPPFQTIGLPEWIDWRVVCGLGGAAMAPAQVWAYRRVTQPPARLVLARG